MIDTIYVGFKKVPEGIDNFLENLGYDEPEDPDFDETIRFYKGDITLIYAPRYIRPVQTEGARDPVPNWGRQIVSQLDIDFHAGGEDEAKGIADSISKKYNGVIYNDVSEILPEKSLSS